MKYAEEVIELMECYPGREFRMAQIVRHVSKGMTLSSSKRHAVRKGVERVLKSLSDTGHVEVVKDAETSAYYKWCRNLRHGVSANCYSNCDNRPV